MNAFINDLLMAGLILGACFLVLCGYALKLVIEGIECAIDKLEEISEKLTNHK